MKLRGSNTPVAFGGSSTPVRSRPRGPVPRLADGVELIGEYRDSGFRQAPYIARLPGGRIVQLTHLLYLVARAADGSRDLADIAVDVTGEFGRRLTAANVAYLLERKLGPLGLLADSGATADEPVPAVAPLALTMRAAVVPAEIVRPLAALLRHLFRPTIVGAALALLVVLDVWLFGHHGLGEAVHETLFHPVLLVLVLGLVICSAAFHELGHAAACRFGGARPGAMGAGLYLVWPAFYTDVTDAYRLDRRGRLRTDLGGIYFNILFVLGTMLVYFETTFEPLLAFVAVQHLQILNQFVPWVRLDGYYVLTDLTGVPDILTRVKPVLLSLIPDRPVEPRVAELKPWVRVALSVYVLTLFPALALLAVVLLIHAPHFFATVATALHLQIDHAHAALARHDLGALALAGVQAVALLLPALGVTVTLGRVALALVRILRRRITGARRIRLTVALAVLGGVAAVGFAAAPSADRTALATDAHARPQRAVSRARPHAVSRTRPHAVSRTRPHAASRIRPRETPAAPSIQSRTGTAGIVPARGPVAGARTPRAAARPSVGARSSRESGAPPWSQDPVAPTTTTADPPPTDLVPTAPPPETPTTTTTTTASTPMTTTSTNDISAVGGRP
jgi:putative peptide zinc metalloprotease protein